MTTLTLDRTSTRDHASVQDRSRQRRGGAFSRLVASQREAVQRAVVVAEDFDRARTHTARRSVLASFASADVTSSRAR